MNVELLNSCSYVRSILETETNIRWGQQNRVLYSRCYVTKSIIKNLQGEASWWMMSVLKEMETFYSSILKQYFIKPLNVWILKLHMTNINTFENRISSMDILPHFCQPPPPKLWLRQLNKTTTEVFSRPAMTNLQPSCPSLPHSLHKVCWNEAWWKVYGGCE